MTLSLVGDGGGARREQLGSGFGGAPRERANPHHVGARTLQGKAGRWVLLLGWLTGSKLAQCEESLQHLLYRPDYEYRRKCKDRLAQSDNPIIKALLVAERWQETWEGPEPIVSE